MKGRIILQDLFSQRGPYFDNLGKPWSVLDLLAARVSSLCFFTKLDVNKPLDFIVWIADLEARVGIEPTHKAFAEPCLTTWLPRHFRCGN
jgi:hypothetical protein